VVGGGFALGGGFSTGGGVASADGFAAGDAPRFAAGFGLWDVCTEASGEDVVDEEVDGGVATGGSARADFGGTLDGGLACATFGTAVSAAPPLPGEV
jgi:hypothetical protein